MYDYTPGGNAAQERVEILFWSIVGLFFVVGILVPIAIGLGTRLWTWALT